MDPDILFCIAAVAAVIAIVGIVAWLILRWLLKPENIQAQIQRQSAQSGDSFEPRFATESIRTTVMQLSCQVKLVGTKTPKATKIFTVVFRGEEDGELRSFRVPEEMYDGFEEGQRGLLTLVDGAVYGFTLDE